MRLRSLLKLAAATSASAAFVAPALAQYTPGATQYAPPPPSYVVPAEGSVPPGYGATIYAPGNYGYGAPPPPAYAPAPGYAAPGYGAAPGYPPPAPAPGPAAPAMMSAGQARAIALNLGYDNVGRAVLQGDTWMMTADADSGPVLLGVNAYTGRLRPLGPAYRPAGQAGPSYPPPGSAAPPTARAVSRAPATAPLPAPRPADVNVMDGGAVSNDGDDVSAAPPPGALVSGDPDAPPPGSAPGPTGAGALTPATGSAGSASVLSR